jgi:hypothetical protein
MRLRDQPILAGDAARPDSGALFRRGCSLRHFKERHCLSAAPGYR